MPDITTTEKQYQWAAKTSTNGIDANVVAATIQQIADREGVCHPARLVNTARPETSPLHPLFQWDDAKAAEAHRVNQARRVIRSVRVVTQNRDPLPEPVFVHVTKMTDDGATDGYTSVVEARADADLWDQVKMETLAQLRGIQRRRQHLEAFATVWAAIDEVGEQIAA